MEYVIETENLTKRYTKKVEAVKNLNLKVEENSIYILLGRNGAGKTTTIKILLGLLSKTSGSVKVFGLDPEKSPVEVRKKVGYVAEEQKMYDWMTIREIINFCRPFYPDWDDKLEKELMEKFELKYNLKLKTLSKGTYRKISLLLALCQNPQLLILDDPLRGLDPISRKEFFEEILFELNKKKITIFFSTHIIGEIENIATNVGILEKGNLLVSDKVENIKKKFKKVEVEFENSMPEIEIPEVIKTEKKGNKLSIYIKNFNNEIITNFRSYGVKSVNVFDLGIEEIFILIAGKKDEYS